MTTKSAYEMMRPVETLIEAGTDADTEHTHSRSSHARGLVICQRRRSPWVLRAYTTRLRAHHHSTASLHPSANTASHFSKTLHRHGATGASLPGMEAISVTAEQSTARGFDAYPSVAHDEEASSLRLRVLESSLRTMVLSRTHKLRVTMQCW